MSYFAIERGGECWDHVIIRNNNGDAMFSNYDSMSYNEMKSSEDLEEFVVAVMEATDSVANGEEDQTIITLIGDDDVFIWSIIIGTVDEDGLKYSLVDWKKNGKSYRYEP
jgi:hypothetical protein